MVLAEIKTFYHALRECGRSKRPAVRAGAMKLIALGRQGKLAYVLSENLHDLDEKTSKAAVEAMVALAKWVASEKKKLQCGDGKESAATAPAAQTGVPIGGGESDGSTITDARNPDAEMSLADRYQRLMDQRPDIESAVARAADVHRGRHGQDLLRAALLLCDWPGSKTMAILQSGKHGGQTPMLRRLQQPPASEHVEAFLLAAAGQLRSHFVTAFAHIDSAPVLDALLRCTHWLKCHQLQACLRTVMRGAWFSPSELVRDIERRPAAESAKIADWLSYSGLSEPVQDEYFANCSSACREFRQQASAAARHRSA